MKSEQNSTYIYILMTVVLCFIGMSASAQYPTTDEFRASIFGTESAANTAIEELPKFKNDTSKIRHLNELAKYFISLSRTHHNNNNHRRAIEFLKESVRLSDSLYDQRSILRYESQMLLAQAYMLSNRTVEGENLYQAIIEAYHNAGNKKGEGLAWYRFSSTLQERLIEADTVAHSKAALALDHAISLYHEINDIQVEIILGVKKANILFRSGKPQAEEYLKMLAAKSLANECMLLPDIYLLLARVKRYEGNLNQALSYSLPALKTLLELGDTVAIAAYYGEIALEYGELGRSAESITYYKKCIDRREKMSIEQYVIYRTATLMTHEMTKNNQAEEGLEFLKSLNLRNPPHGEAEKAILEHGMANCLAASGKYELAEKYYLSMIKGYQQNERNGEVLLIAYFDITKFLISRKQFKKAEAYYDQIIDLSPLTSTARKSEIEFFLFKIDSARSQFHEAIKHHILFKTYNDSIFNMARSEQIENLRIRYSSEQKDQNIELLTKQTELQEANLRQSEITRNSLLVGTIMLGLLLTVLYSRYRLKTKNNVLLEKQQDEISRKNFAQQLLLDEKDWLVRELHHRVKNNFHMVIGLMGTQSAYIKSSEALEALQDSKHRIHTMSLIHQKLYQSENLSATMMSDYIHELVAYLKDSFDSPDILFTINCESIELEFSYSLPLGLILNEAITNSIKYAFPDKREGKIHITLRHTSADDIQLIIADNGIGIPGKGDSEMKATMGLNLMKGLTDDMSGVFTISNENGTIIRIDFRYDVIKYKDIKLNQPTQTK